MTIKNILQQKLEYSRNGNTMFSFSSKKRNLITHSSEYYNLSYEYLNDCLRAGIVYRREFYKTLSSNQKIL